MLKLAQQLNVKNLNNQILHGIADMIRIVDRNNKVIFFNTSMQDMFRGNEEAALCPLGSDDFPLCDLRVTERTLQTGEVIQREEKLGDHYFSVKTSPILGDEQEIVGAIEIYRNKTTEKKLQIELIKKNRAMTKEMMMARNIQQSLLPYRGFQEDVKINYLYRPADMLSGDIFDVFEIDSEHLGFYMADTVGHGFAASMTTMFIQQAMRNMPPSIQREPHLALAELNQRFQELELNIDIYFTIFYMVYNRRDNHIVYSNAGHNCAPILRRDEKVAILESRGFPISRLFDTCEFDRHETEVYTGDDLILYSDGIIEARNDEDEEYGIKRLADLFEAEGDNLIIKLKEVIHTEIKDRAEDDMSLLLLSFF